MSKLKVFCLNLISFCQGRMVPGPCFLTRLLALFALSAALAAPFKMGFLGSPFRPCFFPLWVVFIIFPPYFLRQGSSLGRAPLGGSLLFALSTSGSCHPSIGIGPAFFFWGVVYFLFCPDLPLPFPPHTRVDPRSCPYNDSLNPTVFGVCKSFPLSWDICLFIAAKFFPDGVFLLLTDPSLSSAVSSSSANQECFLLLFGLGTLGDPIVDSFAELSPDSS